jgi:hypothetical protein
MDAIIIGENQRYWFPHRRLIPGSRVDCRGGASQVQTACNTGIKYCDVMGKPFFYPKNGR